MNLAHDMLRKLGSGVRPADAAATLGRARVGDSGFADLLRAAESGEITTGRSVQPAKGSDLTLTDAQQARLATLADKAQLAGVSSVLVQTGASWLRLDPTARTVAPAKDAIGGLHLGIDSVAPESTTNDTTPAPSGAGLLQSLGGFGRAGARIAPAAD
jgi:hypothetical protein